MAKISLRVFKKGKPIYWIVGAIFIFVIFYLLFNKGGGTATGSTSYVATGPSEALQAQGMAINAQVQEAGLAAGVEMAKVQSGDNQAALGLQAALAQIAAGQNISLATLDTQRDIAEQNAAANVAIQESNNAYGLETARTASATQIGLAQISADTITHQLDTNAAMFAEQSRNLITQSLIGVAGSAKHKVTALGEILPYVSNSMAVVPVNGTLH